MNIKKTVLAILSILIVSSCSNWNKVILNDKPQNKQYFPDSLFNFYPLDGIRASWGSGSESIYTPPNQLYLIDSSTTKYFVNYSIIEVYKIKGKETQQFKDFIRQKSITNFSVSDQDNYSIIMTYLNGLHIYGRSKLRVMGLFDDYNNKFFIPLFSSRLLRGVQW